MIIHNIKGVSVGDLHYCVVSKLSDTRFKVDAETQCHQRYGPCINMRVKLKSSKEFCGNHPDACVIGGKDKKASHLEGADWVEFNDLLNDLLDAMNVEADIFSRPLELSKPLRIRKGGLRRMVYNSELFPGRNPLGQTRWIHDEPQAMVDYRGKKAPRSTFPEGTPGIYTAINYNVVG